MGRLTKADQRAFSLLEIVAALGILAIIFLLFFRFTKSFDEQNADAATRMRVEKIVKSAKAYYLKYGDLPGMQDPDNDGYGPIPIGSDGLNIDPKFRFDGWQREMRYISFRNDGEDGRPGTILIDPLQQPFNPDEDAMVLIPESTRTLIRAIEFEGRRVAGLIISSGPDEVFNYPDPETVSVDYGYSPLRYQAAPGSDDIFMPIDLTPEATPIALADLKLLNEKVKAFDDRYLGVDIDGDGQYDEAGCEGIRYVVNPPPFNYGQLPINDCSELVLPFNAPTYYPPPTHFPPATRFDINCGRPTLDYMKANFCPIPGWEGCDFGYFEPEIQEVPYIEDPNNPGSPCPGTPRNPRDADYARIPFVRDLPQDDDCNWGLVQTYGAYPETISDQARAFIFCLFNLHPNAIIDPWLNGYIWGCGSTITRDVRGGQHSGCGEFIYSSDDPRYHRFFSAGPNGLPLRLEGLFPEEFPDSPQDSDDIVP